MTSSSDDPSKSRRGVTSEEILNARQVGVIQFLQSYDPDELVKINDREYRTATHSSLVISNNGLFNWFSKRVGGNNAIDYLVKVNGMKFIDAVRLINLTCGGYISQEVRKSPDPIPPKKFRAPIPDKSVETIQQYLFRRGISAKVFRYCVKSGIVYQSTFADFKNCVFVGLDQDGKSKSAFIRSCSGKWRGDATGSQKKYGFCIAPSDPDCNRLEIYEAPIDAMSGASIRVMMHQEQWRSTYYLAIGGLNYKPIDYFLETHPGIKNVRLCLDNDDAGRTFAVKLKEQLKKRDLHVIDSPPAQGKDYNDFLLEIHAAHRNKQQQTRS